MHISFGGNNPSFNKLGVGKGYPLVPCHLKNFAHNQAFPESLIEVALYDERDKISMGPAWSLGWHRGAILERWFGVG